MNGYTQEVKTWHHEHLLRKWKSLSESAKYANPAQDVYWMYQAVMEELSNRGIDPEKTITTRYGVVMPCDKSGRPIKDEPWKYHRWVGLGR